MMLKIKAILTLLVLGMSFGHAQELTADEVETCNQRAIDKIYDFISYLPEIAAKKNKSNDEQQLALKYIEKALDLFIGEGNDYEYEDQAGNKRMHEAVKIQTISRGRANAPQPVKRFLNRLMHLPYQNIIVDSAEIYIPEKAVLLENRQYSCIFNILLVNFINDKGNTSYRIKNLKKCKLYLSPETYIIGPNAEEQILWPVKLGNIYVKNTYN